VDGNKLLTDETVSEVMFLLPIGERARVRGNWAGDIKHAMYNVNLAERRESWSR
jgi:hypothetical protein